MQVFSELGTFLNRVLNNRSFFCDKLGGATSRVSICSMEVEYRYDERNAGVLRSPYQDHGLFVTSSDEGTRVSVILKD